MTGLGHRIWFKEVELQMPEGSREEKERTASDNLQKSKENFRRLYERLHAAGKLNGITINSTQEIIGSMCVDGPVEKLEELKQFLEEQGIGGMTENFEMEIIH